jgi:hypothetical protein
MSGLNSLTGIITLYIIRLLSRSVLKSTRIHQLLFKPYYEIRCPRAGSKLISSARDLCTKMS